MNHWLAAVGSSEVLLPDTWITERPDLLARWPILGGRHPQAMARGDLLVYYAASHQKIVAIARASGNPSSLEGIVPVQVLLAIPSLKLAPNCDWDALGLRSAAIKGWRAIHLTDAAYKWAWEELVDRTKPSGLASLCTLLVLWQRGGSRIQSENDDRQLTRWLPRRATVSCLGPPSR